MCYVPHKCAHTAYGKKVSVAMNNLFLQFSLAAFLFINHALIADPILSFFMRDYPDPSTIMKRLKKPGKLARYQNPFDDDSKPFAGMFSTYAGLIAVSDTNGETRFPRKHATNTISLVITDKIIPITMMHNTIHHWEINPKMPTTVYSLERIKDKETGIVYWNTKIGSLPENNIIPLESVVIIARPNNVYVPIGATPTTESAHLLLPDIYIKKGKKMLNDPFYIMTINNLFRNITFAYEKKPKQLSSQIR